jgi:hypothetical protein
MGKNRHLKLIGENQLRRSFEPVVETIHTHIGTESFRRAGAFNAAIFDSVMIGVSHRLEEGPVTDSEGARRQHGKLLEDKKFEELTSKSTADREVVKARIAMAIDFFTDVK